MGRKTIHVAYDEGYDAFMAAAKVQCHFPTVPPVPQYHDPHQRNAFYRGWNTAAEDWQVKNEPVDSKGRTMATRNRILEFFTR